MNSNTMSLMDLHNWYESQCKQLREDRKTGKIGAHEESMGFALIDKEFDRMYDQIMEHYFAIDRVAQPD